MRLSDVKLGRPGAGITTAQRPVRVIAVTGGGDSCGKTSIAINLSVAMARAGHYTLLMDADPGPHNASSRLGLHAEKTIDDVFDGRCVLDDILVPLNDRLSVVPAASGARHVANSGALECAGMMRAFSNLSSPVDTLVIDTAPGITGCIARLCRAATEVLVVVDASTESVEECAARIRTLGSDGGIESFRVIANRVNTAAEGNAIFRSLLAHLQDDESVICSFAGYIPEDGCVVDCMEEKLPVVDASPRSRFAMAVKHLASRVSDWPRPGHAGGHLEFFVERLIYNENIDMEVAS